jgi:hypothetical protein
MKKTCTKCLETKRTTDFHVDSSARDGLQTACKECRCRANAPQAAKWNLMNRQRHRENTRRWVIRNRAKINAERSAKYHLARSLGASVKEAKRLEKYALSRIVGELVDGA